MGVEEASSLAREVAGRGRGQRRSAKGDRLEGRRGPDGRKLRLLPGGRGLRRDARGIALQRVGTTAQREERRRVCLAAGGRLCARLRLGIGICVLQTCGLRLDVGCARGSLPCEILRSLQLGRVLLERDERVAEGGRRSAAVTRRLTGGHCKRELRDPEPVRADRAGDRVDATRLGVELAGRRCEASRSAADRFGVARRDRPGVNVRRRERRCRQSCVGRAHGPPCGIADSSAAE